MFLKKKSNTGKKSIFFETLCMLSFKDQLLNPKLTTVDTLCRLVIYTSKTNDTITEWDASDIQNRKLNVHFKFPFGKS